MSTSGSKRTTVDILLDESSSDEALVQMKDGDKFVVSVADAAQACHAVDKMKDFSEQFGRLMDLLHAWVVERRKAIRSAHVTVRESDLLFLAVQKGKGYDERLNDDLTSLDLDIANSDEFNLLSLEVLAVPPVSSDSCQAFQSSGATLDHAK